MGLKFAVAEIMGYATDDAYVAEKYVTFDLCTERFDSGEVKRQFLHIISFGKLAERVKVAVKKGGHYYVRGNISIVKYQDQAHGGVWIERLKILANEFQIVDADNSDPRGVHGKSRQYYAKKNAANKSSRDEMYDPVPDAPVNAGHTYSLDDAEVPVEYETGEIPF